MANWTNIKVETQNFPPANAEWNVDISQGDERQQLVYNNLAYDLIAVMVAKLGVEYSKWILDGDDARLNHEIEKVRDALREPATIA